MSMSEVKHTPGPWQVERDRQHAQVFHVVGPSEIVMGLDGICSPHRLNDRTFNEDEANMRLIAAAPDLLEALKQVMGWVESWSPNFVEDEEWPEAKYYINAAIAKAEGRS
jgi:hypothetical protein